MTGRSRAWEVRARAESEKYGILWAKIEGMARPQRFGLPTYSSGRLLEPALYEESSVYSRSMLAFCGTSGAD